MDVGRVEGRARRWCMESGMVERERRERVE
jgi:hypothetical protein